MHALQIRARDDRDLPDCVAALAQVHAVDGYPLQWPAEPARWLTPPDILTAVIAYVDDTLAGHLLVRSCVEESVAESLAASDGVRPERLASLSRLFVVPAARRRGVASSLIDWARREATRSGLRLVLDVVDDRRGAAMALYESAGWQRVANVRATWTKPDGTHPTLAHYLSPAG